MAQHGKDMTILRSNYDTKIASLNDQIDGYKSQVTDRDKQIKSLSTAAKDNEELKAKFAEVEKANKEKDKEWSSKLASQKKEFAISSALSKLVHLKTKLFYLLLILIRYHLMKMATYLAFKSKLMLLNKIMAFYLKRMSQQNHKSRLLT